MQQTSNLFSKIIKYVGIGYALIGPAIPIIFPNIHPIIAYLMAPAWISLILKLFYDNNGRFYFWATKKIMWIFNTRVDWSLAVEFDGNVNQNIIDQIFTDLFSFYKNAKTWHNEPKDKIIELPDLGCNIHIQQITWGDSTGDEFSTLRIDISELLVPFRQSDDTLDKLIAFINQKILPVVNPINEKYSFNVKFENSNPYFGLFIRKLRLPERSLVRFNIVWDEKIGSQNERVEVNAHKVSFVTKNLINFQTLSKRYITLATLDLTNS